MNKLEDLARDPEAATLIGAATGAVKGALVGIAVGKVAVCVALGVVGGAISGALISRVMRRNDDQAGAPPVPIPARIGR